MYELQGFWADLEKKKLFRAAAYAFVDPKTI